jgi:hypothetical protein
MDLDHRYAVKDAGDLADRWRCKASYFWLTGSSTTVELTRRDRRERSGRVTCYAERLDSIRFIVVSQPQQADHLAVRDWLEHDHERPHDVHTSKSLQRLPQRLVV